MKTTYYFGVIEFGTFAPSDIHHASAPLAIIQRVDVVKEFETPEEASRFYEGGDFSDYVGVDATNQNGVQYQLVFQRHA